MKHLIRRILREETEPDFTEKFFLAIQSVGRSIPTIIKQPLKWMIKNVVGYTPTKARLIFPKKGWETVAVEILESLGVVTGTYESLEEANKFFKELKNNGIVLEELLVGSHGGPGNLLTTQKGGFKVYKQVFDEKRREYIDTDEVVYEGGQNFYFKTDFLEHIKPVVNSETKVYFTACYGADKLGMLKEAADYLGCECYACMGKNAFSFGCEDSNWSCNANTGVDTLSSKIESWDQLEVMTGIDTKNLRVAGPGLKSEMGDDFVTKFYQQSGVCQEQPNVPFNWMSFKRKSERDTTMLM